MKKFVKSLALVLAVALVGIVFVACSPSSLEDGAEIMKEKGYSVEIQYAESNENDIVGAVIASKINLADPMNAQVLYATLFESDDDAEDIYEEYKKDTSGAEEEGQIVKLYGKWVLVGTPTAVNDFMD